VAKTGIKHQLFQIGSGNFTGSQALSADKPGFPACKLALKFMTGYN